MSQYSPIMIEPEAALAKVVMGLPAITDEGLAENPARDDVMPLLIDQYRDMNNMASTPMSRIAKSISDTSSRRQHTRFAYPNRGS
jgi:hypothetical protein